MALSGRWLIALLCVGQIANLLSHVAVPAVMAKHLIPLWGLSATEAGVMAGAYSLGYMLAVPVLMTLTDRVDARLILIAGSAVMGAATVAFGLFAQGFLSASALWALAGIGCAGAYMPGMRAMTDRLEPGDNSRAITLYTSCFSLSVGLSFLVTQLLADHAGWQWSFILTGVAPLVMIAVCLLLAPRKPPPATGRLLNFGPVLRNRSAMGFILGYGVHCFELYGFRTWVVAFWAYVAARNGGEALLSPVTLSVLVTLLALPASVGGNEAALRFGRRRSIACVQVLSALIASAVALGIDAPPLLLLGLMIGYAFTLPGDSGALTSGMAQSADASARGATMAMHSMVGFGMAALGGSLTGLAIDAAGGPESDAGWRAAFALMAVSIVLGPLILAWSMRGAVREPTPGS